MNGAAALPMKHGLGAFLRFADWAVAPVSERRAPTRVAMLAMVAIVFAIAAFIRLRTLGDVVAHIDEQFYLLVGDRMLNEGAIPYVDIWDRKPIGLFLIYAAIRLLGGDGIVEYQLVATLIAGATASVIALWVMRVSGWFAALIAALYYLLVLQARLGFGGQAEVFVNLFLAGAAAIVYWRLRRTGEDRPESRQGLLAGGAAAMLLIGIAIQIKQTAVFPGGWMGMALLWCAWRQRMPIGAIISYAAVWIAAALLPTLAAIGWYAAIGQLDAYIYANFGSVFVKGSVGEADQLSRHIEALRRFGLPFVAAAALLVFGAIRNRWSAARLTSLVFLIGWLAASIVAYASVAAAFAHYALIVAPVGCLLIGYAAGLGRIGWLVLAAVSLHCGKLLINEERRLELVAMLAPQFQAMADAIEPELGNKCLFVYRGPVVLYTLTRSCLPSAFPFPSHLSSDAEAQALPIDADQEVRRILAQRPPVIVDSAYIFTPANISSDTLVKRVTERDYEPIATINDEDGKPLIVAYRLKR